MHGWLTLLHLLVCIFYALQWDIISQTSLKITKASYLLRFFNKTSASVLFLEFRYFELQNIYSWIPNPIRIPIFSSELASSFIDKGAGLVLSIWFILVLNSKNKFIVAKLTVWVWCGIAIMNGQIVYVFTNRLHGKAAELCLANSWNNSVTTTKYIKYINSIPHVSTACVTLFITWCW